MKTYTYINNELIIKFWINWRNYASVSYLCKVEIVGLRNFLMRIHKIFGPIVLSHKSSSEMSASGYVTLLIRSVMSSPSLIASYHLAFKRVLKNNNFFKNHFLISNLTLVEELSAWVVQNYVDFDMKTLGFAIVTK